VHTESIIDINKCAGVHRRIDAFTEDLRRCESEENWEEAIFRHSDLYRVSALKKYGHRLDDRTYWHTLGQLWVWQKITYSFRTIYAELFRSTRPNREHLMSRAEREAFALLPEEMTVYRGYARGRGHGISWSLDQRTACRFAHRENLFTNHPPKLLVGTIQRKDAWAFFHPEHEIVAPQAAVRVVSRQPAGPHPGGPSPQAFDLATVLTGPLTRSFDEYEDDDE
jgi:hypothetical protein